jgi:SPOR domain
MSVSGIRTATEINLDEFERRLRAPAAQQSNGEDPLAEFLRVIESSGLANGRLSSPAQAVSMASGTAPEALQPLETATLQPSIVLAPDEPSGTAFLDAEEPQAYEFGDSHLLDPSGADLAAKRGSRGWTLKVTALALAAGAALIGAVFGLKGGAPGHPKAPPFIAAAQGPTKAQQPNVVAVATLSDDAGATPMKDITQPAHVVTSEERRTVLSSDASPDHTPLSAALAPTLASAAQPPASAGPPVAAGVSPPVVATPTAVPLPAASQFPDSRPVRATSAPPDAMAATPATDSGEAAHANAAPQSPAKPAPKAESKAAAVAQPPTRKLDLPAKLSRRSSPRVVVAKIDPAAETRSEPPRLEESVTPQAAAEPQAAPEAPAEPQAAAPTAPAAAAEQPANPLAHAFSTIVGAFGAPAADQTAASKPSDWAVQFGSPKSEAQAKIDAVRLNAKYGPALNGATIGVQKTLVDGKTIYTLRVAGLSKADAAALCTRVKGRDCTIAK